MSAQDITRSIFDPKKRYSSVRMQQGRVIADDDWNENESIENEERRRTRADIIGAHGTSDDGFKINKAKIHNERIEFNINEGSYYINGMRYELPTKETYQSQKDWLQHFVETSSIAPEKERIDLVYLEGWDQSISAVEDSELFEVAFGGADTSGRIRNMQHVRVVPDIGEPGCGDAWLRALEIFKKKYNVVIRDYEVNTGDDAPKLSATFNDTGTGGDLCSPVHLGGYLGAENQALRIQARSNKKLNWGYDNASTLYRIRINADWKTVTLLSEPKDVESWPRKRHVVEILPWTAVLPNNEKIAAIEGCVSLIDQPYNPNNRTIVLKTTIPESCRGEGWKNRVDSKILAKASPSDPYEENAIYYYMRVWDRGTEEGADIPEFPYELESEVQLKGTGVAITITNNYGLPGDHWIVSVRPETPTTVIPWSLADSRCPNGIRRFRAPLALISWHKQSNEWVGDVTDCRHRFRPLTQLGGCCTILVGDGTNSFGDYSSIQEAINNLPKRGGEICVLPGQYKESITIKNKGFITIKGCGLQTHIVEVPNKNASVFNLENVKKVTLQSLAINAENGFGVYVDGAEGIEIKDMQVGCRDRSAFMIRNTSGITIKNNHVLIGSLPKSSPLSEASDAGKWPAIYIEADEAIIKENIIAGKSKAEAQYKTLGGLQVAGNSLNIAILNNYILGGNGNGITLGSIKLVRQSELTSGKVTYEYLYLNTALSVGNFIAVGPTGCIEVIDTFEPTQPENGEKDDSLVPISDGDISNIKINQNVIRGMGGNGIGVANYFNPARDMEIISVNSATIENNEIHHCARISPVIKSSAVDYLAGRGGIALADVENLILRNNVISNNGVGQAAAICGVFISSATGVAIEGNRISENGSNKSRVIGTVDQRPGNRGGVIILNAFPNSLFNYYGKEIGVVHDSALSNLAETTENPSIDMRVHRTMKIGGSGITSMAEAYVPGTNYGTEMQAPVLDTYNLLPSVSIHNNVIISPYGPALKIIGLGLFSIQGNRLVAKKPLSIPDILRGILASDSIDKVMKLEGIRAAIGGRISAETLTQVVDALAGVVFIVNAGVGSASIQAKQYELMQTLAIKTV